MSSGNVEFDFSEWTVVVTGAAGGIGASVAELFLRSGAQVALFDRQPPPSQGPVSADADERLRFFEVDVASESDIEAAVSAVTEWTGRIDVVVNNAGITRDQVVWKLERTAWDDVLAVHLTGTYNLTKRAIPVMRAQGHGRFVNVTSYSGLRGNFGQANYAAAKAGIVGFTKAVAKEVARFGITVNAISPMADTAMARAMPRDRYAAFEQEVPLGRFASPSEIAPAVAFLASDEAGYITGTVLPVDGGVSM